MSQDSLQGAPVAHQGHLYLLGINRVIALNEGRQVKVLHFDLDRPWLCHTEVVPASLLVPQPMKYFHGATPK